MGIMKTIASVIGWIAVAEGFFIYYSRTRRNVLIFKFISDVLWSINLLLTGGYTGALLNVIAMGRETVFYHRGSKKWASHWGWLAFFIAVTALSPTISLLSGKEGWIGVIPALGSVLGVLTFYQKKPAATRYIGFFAQSLWLVYACFIHNVPSAACNTVLVISTVAGTVRAIVAKKRKGM